jgi:flagellar L-ring protein FlgH
MNDHTGITSPSRPMLWAAIAVSCAVLCTWDGAAAQGSWLERSLLADHTAHRRGDLLTVVITESAAATATARTRADKRNELSANLRLPNGQSDDVDLSLGTDFTGGGQIQRTGKLLARLAVVVEDVDSNGNLLIRGEQDIFVNDERQRIALTGLVRRADISPDNTIVSSRIAAARIDFKGDGILARQQSPGLLGLIFRLFGLN